MSSNFSFQPLIAEERAAHSSSRGSSPDRLPWGPEERSVYAASMAPVKPVQQFLADLMGEAEVPEPWVMDRDAQGRIVFLNTATRETSWRHPLEPAFKDLATVCRELLSADPEERLSRVCALAADWAAAEPQRASAAYRCKISALEKLRNPRYMDGLWQACGWAVSRSGPRKPRRSRGNFHSRTAAAIHRLILDSECSESGAESSASENWPGPPAPDLASGRQLSLPMAGSRASSVQHHGLAEEAKRRTLGPQGGIPIERWMQAERYSQHLNSFFEDGPLCDAASLNVLKPVFHQELPWPWVVELGMASSKEKGFRFVNGECMPPVQSWYHPMQGLHKQLLKMLKEAFDGQWFSRSHLRCSLHSLISDLQRGDTGLEEIGVWHSKGCGGPDAGPLYENMRTGCQRSEDPRVEAASTIGVALLCCKLVWQRVLPEEPCPTGDMWTFAAGAAEKVLRPQLTNFNSADEPTPSPPRAPSPKSPTTWDDVASQHDEQSPTAAVELSVSDSPPNPRQSPGPSPRPSPRPSPGPSPSRPPGPALEETLQELCTLLRATVSAFSGLAEKPAQPRTETEAEAAKTALRVEPPSRSPEADDPKTEDPNTESSSCARPKPQAAEDKGDGAVAPGGSQPQAAAPLQPHSAHPAPTEPFVPPDLGGRSTVCARNAAGEAFAVRAPRSQATSAPCPPAGSPPLGSVARVWAQALAEGSVTLTGTLCCRPDLSSPDLSSCLQEPGGPQLTLRRGPDPPETGRCPPPRLNGPAPAQSPPLGRGPGPEARDGAHQLPPPPLRAPEPSPQREQREEQAPPEAAPAAEEEAEPTPQDLAAVVRELRQQQQLLQIFREECPLQRSPGRAERAEPPRREAPPSSPAAPSPPAPCELSTQVRTEVPAPAAPRASAAEEDACLESQGAPLAPSELRREPSPGSASPDEGACRERQAEERARSLQVSPAAPQPRAPDACPECQAPPSPPPPRGPAKEQKEEEEELKAGGGEPAPEPSNPVVDVEAEVRRALEAQREELLEEASRSVVRTVHEEVRSVTQLQVAQAIGPMQQQLREVQGEERRREDEVRQLLASELARFRQAEDQSRVAERSEELQMQKQMMEKLNMLAQTEETMAQRAQQISTTAELLRESEDRAIERVRAAATSTSSEMSKTAGLARQREEAALLRLREMEQEQQKAEQTRRLERELDKRQQELLEKAERDLRMQLELQAEQRELQYKAERRELQLKAEIQEMKWQAEWQALQQLEEGELLRQPSSQRALRHCESAAESEVSGRSLPRSNSRLHEARSFAAAQGEQDDGAMASLSEAAGSSRSACRFQLAEEVAADLSFQDACTRTPTPSVTRKQLSSSCSAASTSSVKSGTVSARVGGGFVYKTGDAAGRASAPQLKRRRPSSAGLPGRSSSSSQRSSFRVEGAATYRNVAEQFSKWQALHARSQYLGVYSRVPGRLVPPRAQKGYPADAEGPTPDTEERAEGERRSH